MLRLLTDRLELSNVEESDIEGVLAVARSNPAFLSTHEGSGGVPGHYDRAMLERDLTIAAMDPGRHPLVLRRRDTAEVIGWAEVLEEHSRDGVPWIGLLEIRIDAQRQGYGREAAEALIGWARERGAAAIRLGVDDGNEPAARFWARLGFTQVDRRERPSPAGLLGVSVLERSLASPQPLP